MDAARVEAASAGDEAAILELLARYRPPLVRLLTGVTADAALAEDLAQEAFLQAFRCLHQLREPQRFYPWLRQTAVRRALRALRSRGLVAPESGVAIASDDPAAAAETRLAVRAVLARVPRDQRAVLVLREVEQLDYREIAEALSIPMGTVRSRLFAARESFRRLWEEEEADEGK